MVYEKFFYLKENPFNITPDPRFLYRSKKHQEALDLMFFGISERKGFMMLSGEVGTGKTTICRVLLDKLNSKVEKALILTPFLSDIELIRAINEDFGVTEHNSSLKEQLDALNAFLLKKAQHGGNAVVIIDEAQNLSLKALEMVRLLSNFETEKMKLLQIVLVGQPELREKLKLPELRQLNQRIVVRYHLMSLNFEETKEYIFNRLTIAGGKGNIRFTSTALRSIYEASSGIPRLINIVCDRALTAAFVVGKRVVDDEIEKKAIEELERDGTLGKDADIQPKRTWRRYGYIPHLAASAAIIAVIFGVWWNNKEQAIMSSLATTPVIKTAPGSAGLQPAAMDTVSGQPLTMEKDKGSYKNTAVSPENIAVVSTGAPVSNEEKIQGSFPTGIQSGSGNDMEGNNILVAKAVGQPAVLSSEEAVSGEASIFKGLIIVLNNVERTVANMESLEVARGDKLKIVDVIVEGMDRKDVSVNFLGFVGKRSVNTGEDRGYLIDTAKDLWVKYSVKGEGAKYPIVVKQGDKKIGEIFIKIRKPA
ncbi:MAG: AAA family ATPase [Deltaproteobacteria bacterium]